MKIKPEETIQIQGPYGEINGILTPCIEENTAAPVLVLAHGFRGSMDGGGRAAVLSYVLILMAVKSFPSRLKNWKRCLLMYDLNFQPEKYFYWVEVLAEQRH